VVTDNELYRRGLATVVSGWERFARSVRGAAVHRLRHADVAVFPDAPESVYYNNAVLRRGRTSAEREPALAALERLYAAGGVGEYAVWVHEDEDSAREALELRGYHIATSTRAMAMERADFRDARAEIELVSSDWREHKRVLGVDPDLLRLLDVSDLGVLVAVDGGESVATGLSFDHRGDCGIYNVTTVEAARRRGIGAAITAQLVRDAWGRGCESVSLQSTPIAEHVYASIGFRDLGRIVEYSR
jgi:GNAT superfamily N-acetyltransferase